MKALLKFLLVAVIGLIAVVVLGKNLIVKKVIETGVTQVTGFPTTVQNLSIDFAGIAHVQGLKIKNPAGFKNETFVDIPEIYIDISIAEILRQEQIHIRELRLHLQEVNLEKNKTAGSNIGILTDKVSGGKPKEAKPAADKESLPFVLDKLVLTVRKVNFNDSTGVVPKNLSADAKINEFVVKDLTDFKAVIQMIILKVIKATAFDNLGVNVGKLEEAMKQNLERADQLLKDSSAVLTQTAGQVTSKAKETVTDQGTAILGGGKDVIGGTVGETTQALGDAAQSAKDKISDLFGKAKSSTE